MGDVAARFVREQSTGTVPEYRRRVYRLAALYTGVLLCALAANVLIVVKGRLFVTLAQRSNVETLTLAVVLLLFLYLIVVSLPGFVGALRIVRYNLPAWFGGDRAAVERRKQGTCHRRRESADPVYLDKLIRRRGARDADEPIAIPIADAAGPLGVMQIRGAEMRHENSEFRSSNSLYAYFEQRISALAGEDVKIVHWAGIDDETAAAYASLVAFSENLARCLPAGGDSAAKAAPLWPSVEISDDALATLERECTELCPALRDESHLPDMEYSVEHHLPIIPEPLAFITLSRQEQRADPVTSMGCAFLVALALLATAVVFILFPPWVPGK